MHLHLLTPLLLLSTFTPTLAKPMPMNMDEIQRRWSQGETEVGCSGVPNCYLVAWFQALGKWRRASIHAEHNARDATPAWPVVRSYIDGEENFAYATDERTMMMRRSGSHQLAVATPSLRQKMRAFVRKFYQKEGKANAVERRDGPEMEEAPVLKPRRGYRYHFSG